MDELGVFNPAVRLTRARDQQRIDLANIEYDAVLRDEIVSMALEEAQTFIHQDARRQNRIGRYLIDWGHAGRGNPYLDLVRVLFDSQLQSQTVFTEDHYKNLIGQYLTNVKKTQGDFNKLTSEEVNQGYFEFQKIALFYTQSYGSLLSIIVGDCNGISNKDVEFFGERSSVLEKEVMKSMRASNKVIRRETESALVYYLPELQPEFSLVA